MSFAGRDHIINLIQDLIVHCWPEELVSPFEQMFYEDAMNNYGVDKPDLRFDNKVVNLKDIFHGCGFKFIEDNLSDEKFYLGGIFFDGDNSKCLKAVEKEVRMILTDLIESCKKGNSPIVISSFSNIGVNLKSSILKKCNTETNEKFLEKIDGDKIGFIVSGDKEAALTVLGRLRTLLAKELIPDLDQRPNKFVWIVDFPLFVMEDGVLESAHHPFTACHPDDYHKFR